MTPVNGVTNSITLTVMQKEGRQDPEGYRAPVGCGFTKTVLAQHGSGPKPCGRINAMLLRVVAEASAHRWAWYLRYSEPAPDDTSNKEG
jgi:hypothetical protein